MKIELGKVYNMADMPRIVLRHRKTGEFLISANREGKVETTIEKSKAKQFGSMGGANKFIEYENLEEKWVPTPYKEVSE